MVNDEINAKIAGYEWVIRKHLEYGRSVTLSEFEFRKNNLHNGAIYWWLRGAYDALLGLGIITPLDVSQVAKIAGCTRRAVQMAISAGNLKATRIGNSYSIHPLDYENWLNSDSKYKKP